MIFEQLAQVEEFMKVMGQEMPDKPCIPSAKIQNLRFKLVQEENQELIDAAVKHDIVEIADALCDILYVSLGAFTAYGFSQELTKALFDEVQRSNMSKVCHSEYEAHQTIDKLASQEDQSRHEYYYEKVDEYWIVSRASDRKVMKSIGYSKPDIAGILNKFGVEI